MLAMPHDAARLRCAAQVLRLREALDVLVEARQAAEHADWMPARIKELEAAVEQLAGQCDADAAELTWLRYRAETLARIEAGGWWRLRARLLPVIRVASRLLRRGSR